MASYQWKRPHSSSRSRLRRLRQAYTGILDVRAFLNVKHLNVARANYLSLVSTGRVNL